MPPTPAARYLCRRGLQVAAITMIGFVITAGSDETVEITDPTLPIAPGPAQTFLQHGTGLPNLAFGAARPPVVDRSKCRWRIHLARDYI